MNEHQKSSGRPYLNPLILILLPPPKPFSTKLPQNRLSSQKSDIKSHFFTFNPTSCKKSVASKVSYLRRQIAPIKFFPYFNFDSPPNTWGTMKEPDMLEKTPVTKTAIQELLAALPEMFPGIQKIPLANIRLNPNNPGPRPAEEEITELAASQKPHQGDA
jgi:hypothetical protein